LDDYWLPDHVSDERGAEVILEAFKRKVAGDLELLDLGGTSNWVDVISQDGSISPSICIWRWFFSIFFKL